MPDGEDEDLETCLHKMFEAKPTDGDAKTEDEFDEKDQPFAAQLREAIDKQNFDVRGPLGQKFSKLHKVGTQLHADMRAQKTAEDKRNFRVAWAAAQLSKLKQKKTYLRSYQEIDIQKGQYMPFTKVVQEEGGDDSAKTAACR